MARLTAAIGTFVLATSVLAVPVTPVVAAPVSPAWGPAEEVRAAGDGAGPPVVGAMRDGTLVAVWEDDGPGDDATRILRAVRPPGGRWSEPLVLPDATVLRLDDAAIQADGGVLVAYSARRPAGGSPYQVRRWAPDGSLGTTGPANGSDDLELDADAEGDVVASRLGRYDEDDGFDRVLRYHDGDRWRRLPPLGADPGDVVVPGPGDTVWAAGYDVDRSRLVVRRWTPRSSGWSVQWARDYRPGHRRNPLVTSLSLALGGSGHVVLAFTERTTGTSGAVVRSVRRLGGAGWAPPAVLQRQSVDDRAVIGAPVAAAAAGHAEVAWTTSAAQGGGQREVRLARLTRTGPDVRTLAVVGSFSGFRELSLDVDLRADGVLLVSYLERRDEVRDRVAWLGPHADLEPELLVEDVSVSSTDSSFLGPVLAAVVAEVAGGRVVSRVARPTGP